MSTVAAVRYRVNQARVSNLLEWHTHRMMRLTFVTIVHDNAELMRYLMTYRGLKIGGMSVETPYSGILLFGGQKKKNISLFDYAFFHVLYGVAKVMVEFGERVRDPDYSVPNVKWDEVTFRNWMELYVRAGYDVNSIHSGCLLQDATFECSEHAVRILLEYGAKPDQTYPMHNLFRHMMGHSLTGKEQVVERIFNLLMKHGAQINLLLPSHFGGPPDRPIDVIHEDFPELQLLLLRNGSLGALRHPWSQRMPIVSAFVVMRHYSHPDSTFRKIPPELLRMISLFLI